MRRLKIKRETAFTETRTGRLVFADRRPVAASLLLPMALLMCRPAHAAADDKVGINAAVNPAGTGTPPNRPTRQLVIGQDVVFKERVSTTSGGQTQIMFLDESAMSVGPNSDLVIDEFVYDPRANSGKLAMSATRGVFRYVGGKISKLEGGVQLTTPVASIGIRGGAFLLQISGNQIDIIFIYGKELDVTGRNGQTKRIFRPGYRITVGLDGDASDPAKASEDLIAKIMALLDGRAGGNGGTTDVPTDQRVVISGIGNVISAQFEANLLAALKSAGFACGGGVGLQAVANHLSIRCSSSDDPGDIQTAMVENTATKPSGTLVNQEPQPGPYAGSFNSVAAGATAGFAGNPSTFSGGTLQNGVLTATIGGQAVSLGPLVPGSQTNVSGQSPIGPVTGTAFLSSDSSFFYANLSGGGQVALLQGGIPITNPSVTVGGPNQVLAFNVRPDPALGSNIPFIRTSAGGNVAGATVSPLYLVTPTGTLALDPTGATTSRTLQASLAINGTGSAQQSVLVTSLGFINDAAPQLQGAIRGTSLLSSTGSPTLISGGLNSVPDGVGGGLYGTSGVSGIALGSSSPVSETTLNGRTTTYNVNQPAVATATPASVGPALAAASPNFIPSEGYFGGIMSSNQSSPYAITGTTTFTQTGPTTFSATFNGQPQSSANGVDSLTLTFGGPASNTPSSTIVDKNIYGAIEGTGGATLFSGEGTTQTPGTQQLYLVSGAAAPLPSSLGIGPSLCADCAYTQWGYWGGGVQSDFGGSTRIDLAHINFWVAGQPTVSLPSFGVGSYSGNAIGVANNNGAQYIATGTFSNSFDFGLGSGNFQLTFDGRNLTSSFLSGTPQYSGSLIDTATFGSTLSGSVTGKFFGPVTGGVPPETGGNFSFRSISGAPYNAGGVFQGKGTFAGPGGG